MTQSSSAELRARLPLTWPAFFARHGSFTPVQQQAIPAALERCNTLIIAATASGKTEAAIAPLLERHLAGKQRRRSGISILYLSPTKALVRDLYERLRVPLAQLRISLGMKSGDTGPVSATNPPAVLITTPESTDSLLTRAPRTLADLQAIIIDEIHLFDGGPRGDHLQCLLRRIATVRRYRQQELGWERFRPVQRVALSATVPDPAGVAQRYLQDGVSDACIVQAEGGRALNAEIISVAGLGDVVAALARRAAGNAALRKSLIFCNTRNEVEQTAAYLREHLPYDAAIFVHYSNLDPAMRRQVEEDFAQANVAICVSSATLELGIDIGSIDEVALLGPPPTMTSFLQRIGRGSRRTGATRMLALARTPLEEVRFRAMIDLARADKLLPDHLASSPPVAPFRPSVLVQQTFSILKQSPTGALRLADLRRVAPPDFPEQELRLILDHLVREEYLRPGRLGEWRPGPQLTELFDAYEIYSNIGSGPRNILILDAYTGRILAHTDRPRFRGEALLMGGRTVEVVWRDRYRIAVRPDPSAPSDETLSFLASPFAMPLEIGQAVALHLGLRPHELALLPDAEGATLFHFWGDLYGALLAGLLTAYFQQQGELGPVVRVHEHALHLPQSLSALPPWDETRLRHQLALLHSQLEDYLQLGRFHELLPPDLAWKSVQAHCDLPRFQRLYRAAELFLPSPRLRGQLLRLSA